MNRQTALHDFEGTALAALVNLLVKFVENGVGLYLVFTGKEFQFRAPEAVLGRLRVRSGQGESLADLHVPVVEHYHHL